jgi:hypothetical protein
MAAFSDRQTGRGRTRWGTSPVGELSQCAAELWGDDSSLTCADGTELSQLIFRLGPERHCASPLIDGVDIDVNSAQFSQCVVQQRRVLAQFL